MQTCISEHFTEYLTLFVYVMQNAGSPVPPVVRVPSPQELSQLAQSILQSALIKKQLEEQKERFARRQQERCVKFLISYHFSAMFARMSRVIQSKLVTLNFDNSNFYLYRGRALVPATNPCKR